MWGGGTVGERQETTEQMLARGIRISWQPPLHGQNGRHKGRRASLPLGKAAAWALPGGLPGRLPKWAKDPVPKTRWVQDGEGGSCPTVLLASSG